MSEPDIGPEPSIGQMNAWAESESPFEQALFELWRGRCTVSSVRAARLTREQADALLQHIRMLRIGAEAWLDDMAERAAGSSSEDAQVVEEAVAVLRRRLG